MELKRIDKPLTVCKVTHVPEALLSDEYCFIGKTDEELSLVCETAHTPENTIEREDGWRGFGICGVLDFSLIGILARIASLLAENGISIFAVSTYNTDYILVKENVYEKALALLGEHGYAVRS